MADSLVERLERWITTGPRHPCNALIVDEAILREAAARLRETTPTDAALRGLVADLRAAASLGRPITAAEVDELESLVGKAGG